MKENEELLKQIKNLPNVPGCYLYKNKDKELIYVGKAKDLKKRVSSYLNKASNLKTMLLVNEIDNLDYITTTNEKEALVLEQNLIKKYHPKFNILLMDDKRYPYIQITNEKDPHYKYVRKANKDKGKFYGPFPDGTGAREILKLLERIFPLRKCSGNLKKPCMYYHIQQCSGACFQEVPKSYYDDIIEKIDNFFKGNVSDIKKQLVNSMTVNANNLQFEAANRIKILLEKIDIFLSQQLVEFQDFINRDFINYVIEDNLITVVTFFYRNGKLQATDTLVTANNFDDIQDFFRNYCSQLYSKNTLPKEIYLPKEIQSEDLKLLFSNVKFLYPTIGSKLTILNNAKTNAIYGLKNYLLKSKLTEINPMVVLKQWLNLAKLNHLEVFDVSNLLQEAVVGGMIVYKNGKPSLKDYRRFILDKNLKDDYHRFSEMIYRRYYRLLIDNLPLPDLIIVDGARLQVKACKEQLEILNLNIPIIGLVKNKKHQTDHVINEDFQIIKIPKNDISFLFLTNLQDQVHNYAIKFHRQKRSQNMVNSFLANISGIGPKLQKQIMEEFITFEQLQNASLEQLKKVIKSKVILQRIVKELESFKN